MTAELHRYLPAAKGGYDEPGYEQNDGTWQPYKVATYCKSLVDSRNAISRWEKVNCPACLAHAPQHVRIGCKCCIPM